MRNGLLSAKKGENEQSFLGGWTTGRREGRKETGGEEWRGGEGRRKEGREGGWLVANASRNEECLLRHDLRVHLGKCQQLSPESWLGWENKGLFRDPLEKTPYRGCWVPWHCMVDVSFLMKQEGLIHRLCLLSSVLHPATPRTVGTQPADTEGNPAQGWELGGGMRRLRWGQGAFSWLS